MAEQKERTGYQLIFDYDYKGGLNLQGKIAEVWQEEALKNSIRLWIGSFEGDFIGQPRRGGEVMKHLFKPMNRTSIKKMKADLIKSFDNEFGNFARIERLSVTPMYAERKWKLNMAVSSYKLKLRTEIEDYLKGR